MSMKKLNEKVQTLFSLLIQILNYTAKFITTAKFILAQG